MFLSKTKYNELIKSINDANKSVAVLKEKLDEATDKNAELATALAAYEANEADCCECESSSKAEKKQSLVNWINEYIANDLKEISNNKLRAFVAGQIATELGTPVPTEFTVDIADDSLERIDHIMYAAVTLDSYLGAEGLTIRKK